MWGVVFHCVVLLFSLQKPITELFAVHNTVRYMGTTATVSKSVKVTRQAIVCVRVGKYGD